MRKKKEFISPRVPLPVKLDILANPLLVEETDEERWSREYDEENDPDPWPHGQDCDGKDWDEVEDWELLGMDPDDSQEDIDAMWENQM